MPFDTTNWRVVLKAARGDTTGCRAALATLCETYWYPVYALVRRSGHAAPDAEDLTQAYFARFLEKGYLRQIRPDQGRFRSFLFVSVRNFLHNERDRGRRLKRGGGGRPLSLEGEGGEVLYGREPAEPVTPETLFERAWVRTVLDRTLGRLAAEHQGDLRADRFARLKPFLTGEGGSATYAEVAREWGVGEAAVRVAVHRLRKRFAHLLREEVGRTVAEPGEVDEEIRYLLEVASR
jgi:RNA polymerase sigma-70 factor (ECF subfamily)